MLMVFVIFVIYGCTIFIKKSPDKYIWCSARNGDYFRCHLEKDHHGSHECDDFGDTVKWD